MRQFVPMNDDLLDHPDALPGPLVPYRCGLPCWHQLQGEREAGAPAGFDKAAPAANVREPDAATA